ncbi:hypothetical protein FORC065_1610 [Yersinia enterocolitica]|nr:hypothetical protein FORC065_1610 [Yersinia enterocolitica]
MQLRMSYRGLLLTDGMKLISSVSEGLTAPMGILVAYALIF